MKAILLLALVLGLLMAGCIIPPPAGNNTTVIPPGANNTTGIPPGYEVRDYCEKDSDCVRLKQCCDCGPGLYVNIYNQKSPNCTEPCLCPTMLSRGICQNNRCTAQLMRISENVILTGDFENVSVWSGPGECGNEEKPSRIDYPDRSITIRGRIGAPDPCANLSVDVRMWPGTEGNEYDLNMTTVPSGADYCIECIGSIPYEINLTGRDAYGAYVIVYYDGVKVFPNKSDFCGYSTYGSCEPGDCIAVGGTYYGKVCKSHFETLNVSPDELTECDEYPGAYGVTCGCWDGKCQWG